jgi:hypothetical protein
MSGQSSGAGMNAIPAGEIKVDLAKAGEVTASSGGNNSSVLDVFKEINGSQNNMDRLIETMSSGKKFSTQELLQFQVFAHHHTVTYEMMSKFGEMANRAIQTPFQMQV